MENQMIIICNIDNTDNDIEQINPFNKKNKKEIKNQIDKHLLMIIQKKIIITIKIS